MRPEVSEAAESHRWVGGPDVDRGCIDMCSSCDHCRPCTYLWSGLPTKAMFTSEGLDELCREQGRTSPCGLDTGDMAVLLTGTW